MDYEELKEKIEELEAFELGEQEYDDFLDGIYEEVRIGELTFLPSQVLKNCDEVAYRISKDDEEDYQRGSMMEDVDKELTNALSYEEITKEEYDELYKRLEQI